MSTYTWLVVAGMLLIAELLTGTFYLLMLALAALLSWVAFGLGTNFLVQTLVFFISAGVLVTLVYHRRARSANGTSEYSTVADQLDAGEIVSVYEWLNGVGIAHYRGAQWAVVLDIADNQPLLDGAYRIVRLDGTRLRVSRS